MRRSLPILWLACLGAFASCGAEVLPAEGAPGTAANAAKRQIETGSFALHTPAIDVAHAGLRRVDVYDASVTPAAHLAYRERVRIDGEGRFSLEPLEALTQVIPGWELLQRSREGFFFRYRDFQIRDQSLFAKNYVVTDLDQRTWVAGRRCARYHVRRIAGAQNQYELFIDLETNLILKAEEYDSAGELVSVLEYESFDAAPDLTAAIWFQSALQETELDWRQDLTDALGQEAALPKLLPTGFELRGASRIDQDGMSWLKLTYTDGAETVFFLAELAQVRSVPELGATALALPDPVHGQDEVFLFTLGAARAAQGTVAGRRYIAVGKVTESDLLDLIESALP